MTKEKIIIPYVLKGTTEREIKQSMERHLSGEIVSVDIKSDIYEDKECCSVTIYYEKKDKDTLKGSYCPSREEWTKSRNFP